MRIAWIGLGTMGEAMAGHLLEAGHDLAVHNRTREREEALAARGATRAATPREAAAGAELVFTCVSDSPDAQAVTLGPDGALAGMAPGAVLVDCSTIAPAVARELAEAARATGCGAVDAPVSGGSEGAKRGQLTAFVGGEDADVARARPALESFSKSITHLGGPGAGQAGKAVNQVLIAGTYAALGEGLALAEREGLPLRELVDALAGGAAGSWILQNRSGNVIDDTYPLGFRIALHLKDLRIALAEADRHGLPMAVSRLVAHQEERLVEAGYGDEDNSALARVAKGQLGLMAPGIEPYLRIRSASAAGALPTGELGYLSDATGHMQLYQVSSDGLHDQLTFGEERITAAVPSPAERRWLVARDAGGNELHALFALDPDGGEVTLTDDPAAMHVPGAFSPDGRHHAFAHTGRNGTDFDIALVGLDGEGRRELAQPGGYCAVLDWSEAGILVARYARPFDHDLYLCDPVSGALEHLTPHEGEAVFAPAVLLADGAVLCTSDAGCEHARAALLRRGAAPEFLTPDDAEVDAVATDGARARRAWVVNRDGYAELVVDGEIVRELAAGVLGHPHFLAGGGIAITVAPPDDTADAWTLPGPLRRTRAAVGGLGRGDFAKPVLRRFESFDGRQIPYFLYGETGAPTLCHVHGGPESQFRPQLLPVLQYLAGRGIAVAAPNVRGSTGYGRTYTHLDDVEKRLDSVSDLAELARALGAGAGTPVAVMGGSYGGYVTMAAITEHPDLWAAAVNTVGIVNFVTFLERTSPYRRAIREAEYGSLERDRELLERISPLRKVDEIRTPLMVIHGANDPRVPVSEAEQVVEALRERGAEVEYLRYEDEGHGIQRLRNRLDCYPRVAAFLERHLGLA